jgi:hypothetical protein
MLTINELINKFTKKSVGNKSSHIVEVQLDETTTTEPNIGWRMAEYSESPYIENKTP